MSTPTPETDLSFSYEYAVDINLGTAAEPDWQFCRFSSAIDPQVTAVTQDGATYDDNGAPHPIKTSESWTLGFTVQGHRQPDGTFLPELVKLLELAGPEAVGNRATGMFRWYDDPVGAEPNPLEAYQGAGTVAVARQNTGNDQIGGWTVTVTGQGRRKRIENPSTATSGNPPVVTNATPTGAGENDLVTIDGHGFTGATGVRFGSANAKSFAIAGPTRVLAVLNTGTSGSAAITVTTPAGTSAPLPFTRG